MQENNKEQEELNKEFLTFVLRGLNSHYEPTWERICGLVRGDDSQIGTEGGVRYACTKCKIVVEMTYEQIEKELNSLGVKNETVKDNITAKGWVPRGELIVREKFKLIADKKGCNHLEQRLNYRSNSNVSKIVEFVALDVAVKNNTQM